MERNFAAVTIFTLLFAVSAARISLDQRPADLPLLHRNCQVKSLPESATGDSNLVVLPTETTRSRSDRADPVEKSEKEQMFKVDLTPRSDYARFHAINRRFFDERRVPLRPYRHSQNPFVIPRSEISHRNDVILTGESGKFDGQNIHRHGASSRLKFKHDHGHQHRHQHHHSHSHSHRNSNDVSVPKHKFARERAKNLMHQHKEKTRQNEASSFMKSIRQFLKHTFD
ncbi:hypothetical protein L1987_56199 [Smallanthus sonchifolius]|uniref:Uncharacterized protein n=1 Tax=Smallanthus sonchifolius TaxID=185202 RepID=A0ACB9EBR8_9ASTR|nr:hypothetical protein L1987_56199 [Smallanthus sonchifolius]